MELGEGEKELSFPLSFIVFSGLSVWVVRPPLSPLGQGLISAATVGRDAFGDLELGDIDTTKATADSAVMGMDDEILDISNMLLALHGREDVLQRQSRPDARLPHHCIFVKA